MPPRPRRQVVIPLLLLGFCSTALAEIQVVTEQIPADPSSTNAPFHFKRLPVPSRSDAATGARWSIVDGVVDANSGGPGKLRDGRLPREADQPAESFFFGPGTDGGRLQVDLRSRTKIQQVNTYSWHPADRAPQVYTLYGSEGTNSSFNPQPKRGVDPATCGWIRLASVDTRPKDKSAPAGGQHGASVFDSGGDLGSYRYLLFDISRTEDRDTFGNTFYNEIDVVERDSPRMAATSDELKPITKTFEAEGGAYRFTLDTTVAPDLTDWADNQLRPVVQQWYPKLIALLPSAGFSPRTNVTIRFRDDMGGTPASAGGGFINCNAGWFRRELKREALGSVVHEMVHVVQSYGRVRRDDPNATRIPGWLVEGIPDYIRWYLYEPETKGAEITARNLARAKHDASYRITGNFLNWVSLKYDTNLVQKINAAGRLATFREDLWKEITGKTVQELGAEWKAFHEARLEKK